MDLTSRHTQRLILLSMQCKKLNSLCDINLLMLKYRYASNYGKLQVPDYPDMFFLKLLYI